MTDHVFWRDEVRALTLALSGDNTIEMLRNLHGEGHPALWYLLLRAAHWVAPYREVLPFVSALVGFAAMGLFALYSPFRLAIIGLVLFSFYGAFEYVVVARNYDIAVLVMFLIAALYDRIKNSIWLGLLIALLANTNVPSCILAGCFLLFRFIELYSDKSAERSDWVRFFANSVIAAIGAWLCFITVYPPFNDGAVSSNLDTLSLATFGRALVDTEHGFHVASSSPLLLNIVMFVSILSLVRNRPALVAAIVAFVALKQFYYIVYPSDYRHEMLFPIYLLSLHWIVIKGGGEPLPERHWTKSMEVVGAWTLACLLLAQTVRLTFPIEGRIRGTPYTRSADVAELLKQPSLQGAILMGDPDTVLDAFNYYVDNPVWMMREGRFGEFSRLIKNSRSDLTLDDVVSDARRLHRSTGRPVVYLSTTNLDRYERAKLKYMFHNVLTVTPENKARFLASMGFVARLRPALSGESYDVYVYPATSAPKGAVLGLDPDGKNSRVQK
ncbi:hypothetical protein LZ496_05360 [Sphingomonas sp. NSE70-1]|uniref:Glycosyltransferase RgtA/B/C/D-like domain-containing protein n=1 Tax=Sphingomonas caseinilyticus TaxID=2908205 RepID=A0ABT0RT71_9SPHN|nr:hypothetical protein [Sphingomonas caseinilyticus]MCL6698209.1 hypothetical protein [Sphingomonas caseinilyticus]